MGAVSTAAWARPGGASPRDESVTCSPSPSLAPYVAQYSGYWQQGLPPAIHRGLPSPYLTVIFTIAHPLRVTGHPDPAQAPSSWRTLIGGLHLTPATIAHDGAQSGIQAMVTPLGARRLLGLPAGEIAGLDIEAPALLGREAEAVSDRLADTDDWPARFAVVDQFLRRLAERNDARPELPPHLVAAWNMLRRGAGNVPIAAVAQVVGISPRALRRGFAVEFGVTPKQAARIIRFDRARRQLAASAAGAPLPLAELATARGYADQAHLTREFAVFAGLPPAAWLRDALEADGPADDIDWGR